MKIGILGAGHIGKALARLLAEAGHDVGISNSRGPDTLRELAEQIGHGVKAYTNEDAARFGELVIETVPFGHYADLPAVQMEGKIVIDTANYYPERDGQIDLGGLSESAFMARHLSGARVVKAFNAIQAAHLETLGDTNKPLGERRAIPIASDDAEAKALVSTLIEEIGFAAVDNGNLERSKNQQPGTPIYGAEVNAQQAQGILEKQ
ncbi:NADPH-dependent F420 reductase [Deinococcus detaillensis]|uniref:NADPH-dependent F420 reductase n=1 Tax=Deinococcus detaillensis TaxID=2592048 RepID=A0A553V574_9DEIO|nr:NADPH-dependent F420 reductase [Deinococcus detaillensis]TSA87619.1 NADPH-dependent F420 reductase [Deinococcus detaillensis]